MRVVLGQGYLLDAGEGSTVLTDAQKLLLAQQTILQLCDDVISAAVEDAEFGGVSEETMNDLRDSAIAIKNMVNGGWKW